MGVKECYPEDNWVQSFTATVQSALAIRGDGIGRSDNGEVDNPAAGGRWWLTRVLVTVYSQGKWKK